MVLLSVVLVSSTLARLDILTHKCKEHCFHSFCISLLNCIVFNYVNLYLLQQEEEELDIDLTDPDLHKAATKIQASFRGHKVRKEGDGDGKASQWE